jgi:hypothetical protein
LWGCSTTDKPCSRHRRSEVSRRRFNSFFEKLQNKIRRASPEQKVILRKEKAEATAQITALRKDVRDSKEIEQRSLEIQDTLDRAFEAEHTGRNRKEHAYLHENR